MYPFADIFLDVFLLLYLDEIYIVITEKVSVFVNKTMFQHILEPYFIREPLEC